LKSLTEKRAEVPAGAEPTEVDDRSMNAAIELVIFRLPKGGCARYRSHICMSVTLAALEVSGAINQYFGATTQ
jgi:hypothetical protein